MNIKISPLGLMSIATSIAPRNFDKQKAAIQSWLDLNLSVLSFNTADEILQLEPLYPKVTFIQVNRTALRDCGKPLIYIQDILDYLESFSNTNICGIINSDIVLSYNANLIEFIANHAENEPFLALRVEVKSLDTITVLPNHFYWGGIDVFIFSKTILADIKERKVLLNQPNSIFCMGQPWWDFWLALQFLNLGKTVNFLVYPFAFHVTHETAWDNNNNFEKYGLHFLQFYGDKEIKDYLHNFGITRTIQNLGIPKIRSLLGGEQGKDICAQFRNSFFFADNVRWISYIELTKNNHNAQ